MSPDTLVVDRVLPVVGRLRKATGTTIPAVRNRMNRMLTEFVHHARYDLLRAIKKGDLTLMQVFDAYTRHALDTLPTAETIKALADAMRAWIDDKEASGEASRQHAVSLRQSVRYIEAASPRATLNELADIVDGLRSSLGRPHPRSFNLVRAAAQAFVRDTLKRNHPLWAQISAIQTRTVKKAAPRPRLTPQLMREKFPKPADDPIDAIAWAMVTTGMHAKEYWGAWSLAADRVHIEGTKRRGRVRDVPLVWAPVVPAMPRVTWERKIRARALGLQPYDLRRAYVQWLEEAGVPRTRRKLYLGHGASDVTDLYERTQVEEFLASDAGKLRKYLELDEVTPQLKLEEA